MRRAVREKFQDATLRELLVASHPHPLLSIKNDDYWGVYPSGKGENALAKIEMELREEILASSTEEKVPEFTSQEPPAS